MKDEFQKKYVEEANELVNSLEKALLSFEDNPDDFDMINEIFRVMHSLKGGGAMFGFNNVSDFTHNLETIYDKIRKQELKHTQELFDITLLSIDHLRNLLDLKNQSLPEVLRNNEELTIKIKRFIIEPELTNKNSDNNKFDSKTKIYHILFKPMSDIFNNGSNPIYTVDEIFSLGETIIFTNIEKIPTITQYNVDTCYIHWDIFLSTKFTLEEINDIFIFIEDNCKITVSKITDKNIIKNKKFVEHINSKYKTDKKFDINEIILFSENLQEVYPKKNNKLLEKIHTISKESIISSIRVSAEKVDQLMNLVSELVITQASLSLFVENKNSEQQQLTQITENIENITRQLRDTAFSISLVPIDAMLTRFHRLVRDLSNVFNKKIDFVTKGAETELDKTLIQGLSEPLLHIIRNSIDHGIESTEERLKMGKPKKGKITLKAFYSGPNVCIEIKDDGKGISIKKIKEKAIKGGFITNETELSDKDILDLVYEPGFSTAKNVTDISGRGVGMDIVRKRISEIRGEIEIETYENIGTTILIKLPLTLSIIDGLLIKIEDTFFVIPLSVVDKIYAIEHEKIVNSYNNIIILDKEQIPFYYLKEEFAMDKKLVDIEQLVVVRYEDKKIGMVVDNIVGEIQAVLKPLGKMYKNHEILSGATILGDGTVALVLDTNKIINDCSYKSRNK